MANGSGSLSKSRLMSESAAMTARESGIGASSIMGGGIAGRGRQERSAIRACENSIIGDMKHMRSVENRKRSISKVHRSLRSL